MGKRPWLTDEVIRECYTDPYAEFSAWQRWFRETVVEILPEYDDPILDKLTALQRSYLFNVMIRLADGVFTAESRGHDADA